jgi:hypothetical protein
MLAVVIEILAQNTDEVEQLVLKENGNRNHMLRSSNICRHFCTKPQSNASYKMATRNAMNLLVVARIVPLLMLLCLMKVSRVGMADKPT